MVRLEPDLKEFSVKKRTWITIAAVVVVAAAVWLGGQAVWHVLLAMHGQ